jgi:AAA ATPase containing von Willebrand factor type A (vWA) domain
MNWWVSEISDPIHWDVDGLGIIDPRQFQYVLELIEPLSDYGLQTDIVEDAFYTFGIDNIEADKSVLLKRVKDSILESEEQLFALPDVMDEEKGPYADLLDHITRLRVKMLNDLIDFSQNLTVEELEEDIREQQNSDFIEGRATHFFTELTSILEYVPDGFELDSDDENSGPKSEDEELEKDLADVGADDDVDENIEADETMKWDEEEEEEEDYEETTAPPDEDEDDDRK